MTTAADLVTATHRMLLAGTKEELNTLSAAIATTSVLTFTTNLDLRGIQGGAVVEVDDELLYVTAIDSSTKTVTVLRSHEGSTAATHASGSVVRVNPKFARVAIFDAMNDSLDDLSGEGLFQEVVKELTFNSAIQGYNVTGATEIEDLIEVRAQTAGPSKRWPRIPRTYCELGRGEETDDFASGFVVWVNGGQAESGRELRVSYKAPFTRLTATTDDVNTVAGLRSQCNDLLKYAAAMKLVYWRETMRNVFESQGDSRRAQEVPAGANIGAARAWQAIYTGRLNSELRRQKRRYQEASW